MLRHESASELESRRYDSATLSKVTRLAQELKHRHEDTLSAAQIEEIGAEVGLSPVFIRDALQQMAPAPATRTDTAPQAAVTALPASELSLEELAHKATLWGGIAKAWWSAGWALPFFLLFVFGGSHGPEGPALAGFFMGWAAYAGFGSYASHMHSEMTALRERFFKAGRGRQTAGKADLRPAEELSRQADVSRRDLLDALFTIQSRLDRQREYRAFLSVDVAGSSEMKRGADELAVEYSFSQYHQWVASVCRLFQGEVQSSAGDGMMCCFPSAEMALRAARRIQEGVPGFNEQRNRLGKPFRLRCGVSAGEVALDPTRPLGTINSAVIDRAAVMQRRGEPGDIVVSAELAQAGLMELGALAPLPGDGPDPAFAWLAGRHPSRIP